MGDGFGAAASGRSESGVGRRHAITGNALVEVTFLSPSSVAFLALSYEYMKELWIGFYFRFEDSVPLSEAATEGQLDHSLPLSTGESRPQSEPGDDPSSLRSSIRVQTLSLDKHGGTFGNFLPFSRAWTL